MNDLKFGSTFFLSPEHSAQYQQRASHGDPRQATRQQRQYLASLLSQAGHAASASAVNKDCVSGASLQDGTELIVVGDGQDTDYQDFLAQWQNLHAGKGNEALSTLQEEFDVDRAAAQAHIDQLNKAGRTIAVI